jgi:predicted AAA+ superfamily ATPase
MPTFQRPQAAVLAQHLAEPRHHLHVVAGPRQVESAVGAHLANAAAAGECELYYWRERNQEVDFVVKAGRRLAAIEVKSGRAPQAHRGTAAFAAAFKTQRNLLVGGDGIELGEFLSRPVSHWVIG